MKNSIGSIVKKYESPFSSSNNDNFVYKVNLLHKRISRTFDNFPEAKKFIDKHAEALLATKKVHIVSIKYTREDRRSSYFIYENKLDSFHCDEDDFKKYEQSEFDFYLTNEWTSRREKTRKLMNVRYYSFHDAARVSCLMNPKSIALKLFLAIALIITTSIFLAYGMHVINNDSAYRMKLKNIDKGFDLYNGRKDLFNVLIPLINGGGILGGICMIFTFVPQWRVLLKNNYNYDYIQWKSLYRKRKYFSIFSFLFLYTALSALIAFYVRYSDSQVFIEAWTLSDAATFRRVLFASTILVGLGVFTMTISISSFYFLKNKILRSYFTKSEQKRFNDWISNKKDVSVPYKTDQLFYIYPYKECELYALNQIAAFNKLNKTTSIEEWKQAKKKSRGHLKIAIKQYFREREI